ncbi:MAG: alpha/beta hydrolase [Burkholderiales bacterium]|nr:alpha/beta hydrolase [Burkholderiales bacterium]
MLLPLLLLAIALTLALLTLPLALQRNLLFPAPKKNAVLTSSSHRIEALAIPVGGRSLRAYLASPIDAPTRRSGLLYFNGRREHPTSIFRCLGQMPGQHLLCFHYEKLGPSLRKPDEARLVADGLAMLDWLSSTMALDPSELAIAGRSLGSGIAIQVCALRPVRRLVLVSPYGRLIEPVRAALPFMREWMLKDQFRSVEHIERVACPTLLVLGERDQTVPAAASRRLFRAWPGELSECAIAHSGHRGLLKRPEVQRAIAEFCRPDRSGQPAPGPVRAEETAA